MGLLDWFKTQPTSPPAATAVTLAARVFDAAQIAAVASLSGTEENRQRFVGIAEKAPDRLLVTVVAAALPLVIRAACGQQGQFTKEFYTRLRACLERFNPLAPQLFSDGLRFIESGQPSDIPFEAASGFWLIWNLKGSKPSTEELREGAQEGMTIGQLARSWFERAG
jgi:hypothetical protein